MPSLIYLSVPYASPDPAVRLGRVAAAARVMAGVIASGRLVICPIVMLRAAEAVGGCAVATSGDYWVELEARLADACDELMVVEEPGWRDSRGIAREISLFEAAGKPVTYVKAPHDSGARRIITTGCPAHPGEST